MKRKLALAMAFLLFMNGTAPTAEVFAQTMAETRDSGITDEPTIMKLSAESLTLKADDRTRTALTKLTGTNLSKEAITVTTEKIPADAPDIKWGLIPLDSELVMGSALMPEARDTEDIIYKTTFSTANGSSKTISIVLKSKSAKTTEKSLKSVDIDPATLPKSGGDVMVTLKGENLEPADILSKIRIREAKQDIPFNWEKKADGLQATLSIPANTTKKKITYSLYFEMANDMTQNQSGRITVLADEGESAPEIHLLNANPTSLSYEGGETTLNIMAKNAKADDIFWTVKKDGQIAPDLRPRAKSDFAYSLSLPENKTDKDSVYTIEAKTLSSNAPVVTKVTVKAKSETLPTESNSKIIFMGDSDKTVDAKGGEETFNVIATPNTNASNVKLRITANGEPATIPYTVTGDGARKTVKIDFPENKTASQVVYKITFNAKGSDTEFQKDVEVTFTQAPGEVVSAKINEMSVSNDQLPLEGGDATVSLKGTDLSKAKLITKLYKIQDGTEEELPIENYLVSDFMGVDKAQSATLNFPEVKDDTEFLLKVSADGQHFLEKTVYQTSEGSNRKTESLAPKKAFTIGDNSLIVDFNEPVEEARTNAIVKNLKILAGNDSISLKADDAISFDGTTLRIDFKEPVFMFPDTYRLSVGARTFKLNEDAENAAFDFAIERNAPYIESATFVEGYILDSPGGEVVLKLKGYNLPEDLKVKILENNNEKTPLQVTPDITGGADEKTVRFTAPANETDRVQSYSVLVSTDGKQYSSEISNMENRFRRMVVSVLPEDAKFDAPQIDFMQIQSYGNTEGRDTTHTNTPAGQGSKKTLVWIYGANLNADHTRVRLVDKNGVYWSPTYSTGKDKSTSILMTMLDGMRGGTPGMTGKGNNMLMEIILPSDYKPDEWEGYNKGTTFKYEVAPDGVNFDTGVKVSATVSYDGREPKIDLNSLLANITVRHVDKQDKDLVEPEDIKAYEHLSPNNFQKLLPLRNESGFMEGFMGYRVADTDELVKGAENEGPQGIEYYDGKTVKELVNENGEIVLVYDKEQDSTEPDKSTQPNEPDETTKPDDSTQPSEPSKPTEPTKSINPAGPSTPSDDGEHYVLTPVTPAKETPKPEIESAPQTGYISGYPDNTFRPAKPMTRAEAASILARLNKLPVTDTSKPAFTDADGWYNGAINSVVKTGYMKGYPDGSFKPEQPITRAEFAQLLSSFLNKESAANPFTDTANSWAKKAINKAYAQNIAMGYEDNTFRPESQITRAESVAMMNRTFKISPTSHAANPFVDVKKDYWAYDDILAAVNFK